MCFDERTSWLTLVIGTIVNLISLKVSNKNITKLLILYWQFTLLMQLPEALLWRSNGKSKFANRLALFLNILQPVVLFLLLYNYGSKMNKKLAILLITVWVIYLFLYVNLKRKATLDKDCIQLSWWKYDLSGFLYIIISVLLLFLLLNKKKNYMILTLILFLGTLLIDMIIYNKNCLSYGSRWCWLISSCGFITIIFEKLF